MKKYVIEYDAEADSAYIRVAKRGKIKDTIELGKGMFADVDSKNRFVGIEILNFSKKNTNVNELISKELDSVAVAN